MFNLKKIPNQKYNSKSSNFVFLPVIISSLLFFTFLCPELLAVDSTILWGSDAKPIAGPGIGEDFKVIVSDQNGGVIAVWQQGPLEPKTIYAQRLNPNVA